MARAKTLRTYANTYTPLHGPEHMFWGIVITSKSIDSSVRLNGVCLDQRNRRGDKAIHNTSIESRDANQLFLVKEWEREPTKPSVPNTHIGEFIPIRLCSQSASARIRSPHVPQSGVVYWHSFVRYVLLAFTRLCWGCEYKIGLPNNYYWPMKIYPWFAYHSVILGN